MSRAINLNADLGESFGPWPMGSDDELLAVVRSANIACGFHAGDPLVMRRTVRAAGANGVSLGAHPGFPDLQGFGRRQMKVPADELAAMLIYQIGALQAIAAAEGLTVSHVKPHGALNNMACADAALARVVAEATAAAGRDLILLAPACSLLAEAGAKAGLQVGLEVFADRAYCNDGQLVPRGQPGAMIHDAEAALAHVLTMLERGGLVSLDGSLLPTAIHSICVHGDGPQAVASARRIRDGLTAAGYAVQPLPAVLGQ